MNKKEFTFVALIILISVLIRFFGLNMHIYDDESMYASAIVNAGAFGFNPFYYTPILMQWLQLFFTSILGLKMWVLRLVPLIFGTFTMLLSYQLAKEKFGIKSAKITLVLLGFCFYPILTSLQLDPEGSLITFFYLLAVYSFFKIEQTKKLKWKIICGLSLLLSLLSKNNAILIFVILFIYLLVKEKINLIKVFKRLFIPFLIGIGGYSLFLYITYLINPKLIQFMFNHGSQFFNGLHLSSIALPILLFWGTPLLIGLTFLSIYYYKHLNKKESLIFYVWLSVVLGFYVFIIEWGDYSRYLSNLIPVMAILSGTFLSKFKFKSKEIFYGFLLSIITLRVFFWLNQLPQKLVPRIFESYLAEIIKFNFNFMFSYTTSSGPTFGINFLIIFISLIFSLIAIISIITLRNKRLIKYCMVIFISIGFAFNIFLVSELIFHPTSPDVGLVQSEMVNYFKENNLSFPMYSNDEGIMFDLNQFYIRDNNYLFSLSDDSTKINNSKFNLNPGYIKDNNQVISLPDDSTEINDSKFDIISNIHANSGTILLLHWPPLSDDSPVWKIVTLCNLQKEFYSKNVLIGEIYICNIIKK